ncbi:hypothetical protein BCV70DRAFT_239524 [Testicularia cyperi]|uniref:Thioesterase domain-containing protein n=1 Tax=Testicularia cyperi TaxID=1882483 RepID=A0A317XHX7_9BASI|nr:hypothetical protein BCV70DRAFT_239524 [Testicularia cyperi]
MPDSTPTPRGSKAKAGPGKRWPHTTTYQTRWLDNDQYGHLNNSVYYLIADSVINAYLVQQCGLRPYLQPGRPSFSSSRADVESQNSKDGSANGNGSGDADVVALMISNSCTYFSSCAFPEPLLVGLRVTKLGTSSVRYQVAIRPHPHHPPIQGVSSPRPPPQPQPQPQPSSTSTSTLTSTSTSTLGEIEKEAEDEAEDAGEKQWAAVIDATHVFVDRHSRRPKPIPSSIRTRLLQILVPPEPHPQHSPSPLPSPSSSQGGQKSKL